MRRPRRAELEEVPPFCEVRRHDDLRLQAVRQNAPRLLRRASEVQQIKIRRLCPLARIHPDLVAGRVPQSLRLDDRDLAAEAPGGVVAVARGFLAVRRQPMPHDFVTDTPVDCEQHRHILMRKPCRGAEVFGPFDARHNSRAFNDVWEELPQ